MSQLFALGGRSIGVSASASVLPMNTRDWSPSEWTGWISSQPKGLSGVFSITVEKHCCDGSFLMYPRSSLSTGDHSDSRGSDLNPSILFLKTLFTYLAVLGLRCGMWESSSLSRNQTWAPCIRREATQWQVEGPLDWKRWKMSVSVGK